MKNIKVAGREDRPFLTNYGILSALLSLVCTALFFYRHESARLVKQTQQEIDDKNNQRTQTSMNSFLSFKSEIKDNTKQKYI